MRVQNQKQKKGALPEIDIPPDCEVVRFFFHRGLQRNLPVVDRSVVVGQKKVPELDIATGKQAWRSAGEGKPKVPIWKNEPIVEKRTALLVPSRTGELRFQYHFEPDKQTLAERARREKLDRATEDLAAALVDRDVTVDQFLDAVLGEKEPASLVTEEVAVSDLSDLGGGVGDMTSGMIDDGPELIPPEDYEFGMKGPGLWPMPDGTKFKGKKVAALAHLEANFPPEYGPG